MSLSERKPKKGDAARAVLDILKLKLRDDPAGFRAYLPEVAQILDAGAARRAPNTPFHLTERERARRRESLDAALTNMHAGELDRRGAISALEDYAALADDASVPGAMDFATKKRLFSLVAGRAPSGFQAKTELTIAQDVDGRIVHEIALIRGVHLRLTWHMRLVSIAIEPARLKERAQVLGFVGSARDAASDVARDHDRYIAEIGA